MKMFIIWLFLAHSLLAAIAQDAAFALDFHEDYATALTQAKKEKKLLMLVIVQDPCPYCDGMVDNTLSDPKVTQAIKDFVPVIVDKHTPLPAAFKTDIAPLTFFIDAQQEEGIWESMGYVSVESFLDDIKEAKIIFHKK
ncbi:thioredoxin family protein [Campylobacterota bacterium]